MASFLKELDFKKSGKQFADGRKLVESALTGKFTREQVLKNLNKLAETFDDDDVQLGCAIHYKKIGKWAPALFRKSNHSQAVWDWSDSPETAQAYRDDSIDAIHMYILENKTDKKNPFHRPSKK